MRPENSKVAFEGFARNTHGEATSLSMLDAVDCFLRFYAEVKPSGVIDEKRGGDMLLFQYGCYDFGKGLNFDFDLTRQFISIDEMDDDAISQLNFTFFFEPRDEFRAVGARHEWCYERNQLPEFRAKILSCPAYSLTCTHNPASAVVRWSKV